MSSWDRGSTQHQAKVRDAALRAQIRDRVRPFSPYWRERFAALRLTGSSIQSAKSLAKLPAVGERDVCPDGDPAGAAALVLQADESGFALHVDGPTLRKAMLRRIVHAATYRRQVEAASRPLVFHWAGRAFSFPVASTRSDLDLVARAGARAWSVLGLSRADVLVSAVPVAPRLDHMFLSYAALGAGAPALFPGADPDEVAAAIGLVPTTVLAVPAADAVALLTHLEVRGTDLSGLTTLVVVGDVSDDARTAIKRAVEKAGAGRTTVLAMYGPDAGRVMWAECRESTQGQSHGYHTYPDLDLVELVDPSTTDVAANGTGGELVVTQLGFAGTALVRWRTGDVVSGPIERGACPGCKRTVPRIPAGLGADTLAVSLKLRGRKAMNLDLRSVAGALSGRPDLADWQVEVATSDRDGAEELLIFVEVTGDESDAAAGAYRDVRATSGVAPTQVIVVDRGELAERRDADGAGASRITLRR